MADEYKVSLAALMLFDAGCEISADKIKEVLSSTNNEVAPYWPVLFASFANKGSSLEKVVLAGGMGGGGGGGGAAPAAAAGAAGGAPAAEEKKEKPKVEEVDALDGGMDMFGGGGGGGGDY